MFICEIWLFNRYFPQYCKSDMSKYGYLEPFQRVPSNLEITRVDYTTKFQKNTANIFLTFRNNVKIFLSQNIMHNF